MAPRLHRLLLLGAILALLGAGCGGGGKLGAKALRQQSKSLRSAAAEGALLARDASARKTTRIYMQQHSAALRKAAAKIEASLKSAKTEPALQPELRRLRSLAAEISAGLDRLGSASKDEQRTLGDRLQGAAQASEKIGERLK